MGLLIIILACVLIIFGTYRLCMFLNKDYEKQKINICLIKVCLICLSLFVVLFLFNCVDGYLNGTKEMLCDAWSDCNVYGFSAVIYNIIKLYWTTPFLLAFITYLIINNVKFKNKIIDNKRLYFIGFFVILILSFIPLYSKLASRIYFNVADYKYELVMDYDGYDYRVQVYDKKINVIKKDPPILCITSPCPESHSSQYEIKFSNRSMNKIFEYINDLFEGEYNNIKKLSLKNIDNDGYRIINAIVMNDETFITDKSISYDYKITTDYKYITMQNDGGSNKNIYYLVSLGEKKIIKCEDSYIGFKGYEYKDKIIYEKRIYDDTIQELSLLIKDLFNKIDVGGERNYSPYTIEVNGDKKTIYNSESINALKNIFESIDDM